MEDVSCFTNITAMCKYVVSTTIGPYSHAPKGDRNNCTLSINDLKLEHTKASLVIQANQVLQT